MPKFSIIVPIYKVEKYIHKSIDSILKQSFTDFELILVDDGSPDNSGSICDEYAVKDSRVRVIHKENGGVSAARNIALNVAKGKYIAFVDSDDWIEDTLLEECFLCVSNTNADIVIFDWYDTFGEKKFHKTFNIESFGNIEKIKKGIFYDTIPNLPWNKIYKRRLWENVRFVENVNFEDLVTIPDVFEQAKSITYLQKPLYNYRCDNVGSITSNISARNKFGFYLAFKKRGELGERISDNDLIKLGCFRAMRGAVSGYGLNLVDNTLRTDQVIELKEYIKERPDIKLGIDIGLKYKLLAWGVINCEYICKIYGNCMYLLWSMKKKIK